MYAQVGDILDNNEEYAPYTLAEWTTQKRGTGKSEAPGNILCFGDPYTRACYNWDRIRGRGKLERRTIDRHSAMLVGDAQRLAYPARAGTEKPLIAQPSPFTHDIQPGKRFDRANQYASSMPRRTADKIQTPVNAVRAIDVGMAGRAEHHLVTPGRARKAV
ncbi:MAG: hypothetical protein ABS69_05025 [Nitrosomonadales bacterium SCN 54-20]|nr:MAG: hypothetical protein ABS69_05025 [Nitrosomonadales bacterium SCN 54-20]